MRHGRFLLALTVLSGSLVGIAGSSAAQSAGSELAEAVTAEASGDAAYVVLQSLEAFAADGGGGRLRAGD